MKTAIFIISVIAFLLYVSGLKITTNPFSISLPTWYRAVALILVCAGFVLYNLGEYMRGYNEGKNDIIELMYSTMKDNEAKNE